MVVNWKKVHTMHKTEKGGDTFLRKNELTQMKKKDIRRTKYNWKNV